MWIVLVLLRSGLVERPRILGLAWIFYAVYEDGEPGFLLFPHPTHFVDLTPCKSDCCNDSWVDKKGGDSTGKPKEKFDRRLYITRKVL
jgi:hypothetical protein